MDAPPDVIMVQETHMEKLPKLPGYRVHASPPSARTSNAGAAQGVCTFFRKGLTLIKLDRFLDCDTALELCAVEVVIGRKKQESVFLVNAYSNPQHRGQRFKTLEILRRVGLRPPRAESYRDEAPERTEIGRDIARHLVVLPLPRNIHPQRNKERRVARARALAETHASDSTAVYVDAAKHQYRPHIYVAVVVRATDGKLLNACSVRATSAEQTEEAAIALALNGTPQVTTILSDSRTAIANFGRGSIGTPAASLLPRSKRVWNTARCSHPPHAG
ncbi:hypothetical protein MRX96_015266 [Rhipicephalus microplus]